MSGDWQRIGRPEAEVPQTAISDAARAAHGIPLTLRPVRDPLAVQRAVFDPALKQHPNAFRAADPDFVLSAVGSAWYEARRRAIDLVLAGIAGSPWAEHLVLRGSLLLRCWYGGSAREPGDLDFVVVPGDWGIGEPRTAGMFAGIAAAAERAAGSGPVRIDAGGAVIEDIWTYDRVPGRRMVLPWTADELPGGGVQIDVVFNETLPVPPEPTPIPSLSGATGGTTLWAATPELSLAWKVMWLVSDMHAQGKDLYDAVLLAESCRLRYEVLRDAFLGCEVPGALRPLTPAVLDEVLRYVEWTHFEQEYPGIPGSLGEFSRRLTAALAPTFTGAADPVALERRWLAPWLAAYRVVDPEAASAAERRLRSGPGSRGDERPAWEILARAQEWRGFAAARRIVAPGGPGPEPAPPADR